MASVNEVTAEEVIEEQPVTVSSDKSLSSIKNTMEKEDLRAIPVVDSKNRLEGVIGYRDLIRFIQFNPSKTGLDKVMHQPPSFEEGDTLVELADLRINSGRKLLVKLGKKDKLEGVVGDREFAEAFKDADELEKISTQDIHNSEVETAFEQDTLEETRHRMLDENISSLPVIDQDGKLTGIIRSTDFLQAMVPRESQNPGGTSGNRHGSKEVNIAGGSEKKKMSQVTVDELMERQVLNLETHVTGKEAVEQMLDREMFEIVFVKDSYPESIATLKDFIHHVSQYAPGNTVLVNLTGVEVEEEKRAVHNKIRTQLQGSLGRKLQRPEEVSLRVKKSEKDGKKHRYEIDLKLYSEYGLTTINEEGWELLDVVDEALDELNTVVRKKKEKRSEH